VSSAAEPVQKPATSAAASAALPIDPITGKPIPRDCKGCENLLCPGPLEAIAAQCTNGRCEALRACVKKTRCDRKTMDKESKRTPIDLRYCYCGEDFQELDFGDCFGSPPKRPPHGACKEEIEKLAGKTDPTEVGLGFFERSTSLGAVGQIELCHDARCYSQCF
jgi:hypothetical protein